jgi:hypothetical protein
MFLKKMNIHPGYPRIRLINYQKSSNYLVTPYELRTNHCLGVPCSSQFTESFIVKVNGSTEHTLKEIDILEYLHVFYQ